MKSAWTRFLSVAAVVSLLCAGTACNQKEQNEESTSSNTPVMDTTISQQAYLSELVDPATASTGIGEAPSAANPSAAAVGTSVNDAFFDDAVFVGDSVSLKLNYYVSDQRNTGNCLGKSKFLTSGSLGSAQALLAVSDESLHPTYQGQKLSIEETIANIGAKKVFIMLGMNDIAVYGIEGSVDNYEDLVNAILALSPDAEIYAQSCTPIAMGCERSVLNNKNIVLYNEELQERCLKNGWHYMDIYSVVADEHGYLSADYCSDPEDMGIHFTDAGCQAWIDYLMANAG